MLEAVLYRVLVVFPAAFIAFIFGHSLYVDNVRYGVCVLKLYVYAISFDTRTCRAGEGLHAIHVEQECGE